MAVEKKGYYRRDDVAGSYDEIRFSSEGGRMTHEREIAVIKDSFKPGERVLEIGCGTARLLKALNAQGWDVMGMDQSVAMLRAGGLEPGPKVLVGDVRQIPLPDASVDGIYTFRMTNHFADLRPVFAECKRVLKPGGKLLFDTMRWSFLIRDWAIWGGMNFPVSDETIRAWLAETGLELEKYRPLFPVGPYLIGRMPAFLGKLLMRAGNWPASKHAVAYWRVRKP